jgi:hypothetical protein
MNFVGFPFRTFKFKNDISYTKYKFSHRLGKVCRSLNMYYSNIRIIIKKKEKKHGHLNHFKEYCLDL